MKKHEIEIDGIEIKIFEDDDGKFIIPDRFRNKHTALKPSFEPIVLAQKPREGTYAENVLEYGVGGLNIDGCRIEHNEPVKKTDRKEGQGNTWNDDNTGLRDNPGDLASPSQKGRFPANVILDPIACELLDMQSGKSKSTGGRIGTKDTGKTDVFDSDNSGLLGEYEKGDPGFGDEGGASRFFYSAKAHKSERNAGLQGLEDRPCRQGNYENRDMDNPNNHLGGLQGGKAKNDIATLKPINLVRYLTRLVTPPNGTVLDPFFGSGTTGCACEVEGFAYIGIEKRERFAKIIAPKRIEYWSDPRHWDELKEHKLLPDKSYEKEMSSSIMDFVE